MRKSLAQRQRERAVVHAENRKGVAPVSNPTEELVEEEDAAELEYQEKTTRKKRSYTRRSKKDDF